MSVQIFQEPNHKTGPSLSPKIKAALADFQRRVLGLFADEISQLILFGSCARGEATPDSDVDVMVVVGWDDPEQPEGYYLGRPSDPRWTQIIDAAVDSMIEYGPLISALVIGESLFNTDLSVAQNAKREGVILWTSHPA